MKQRDIILVPFPFSDQSGQKIRPALIVSNDKFNSTSEDAIVCAITSNIKPSKYSIIIDKSNLEEGILHENCAIKAETVLKLNRSLVIKKIAKLDKPTFSKVNKVLSELLSP